MTEHGTLTAYEPSGERVPLSELGADGPVDLLTRIEGYISTYVSFPQPDQARVLAAWVLHTWAFQTAHTTPYIYVHSPEKQSGKSLLVEVLGSIVRNPMKAIDVTGPVLFRAIDKLSPTVLLDEADAVWSGRRNEGLRGIVNGGYKQGGHVWRLSRGEPVKYDTFCPKLLAGIHNGCLPDTILDRCIPVVLRRKPVAEGIAPFYVFELGQLIEDLLGEIEGWVVEHAEALASYRQPMVSGLSDREAEIAWPLLAIAAQFGAAESMAVAIAGLIADYHESMPETDKALETVRCIAEAFEETGRRKLHTEEILAAGGMDSTQGKLLSTYLDRYDIHPRNVRIGNRVAKGYTFEQFEAIFTTYAIEVDLGVADVADVAPGDATSTNGDRK
jgi:hypothetical protein